MIVRRLRKVVLRWMRFSNSLVAEIVRFSMLPSGGRAALEVVVMLMCLCRRFSSSDAVLKHRLASSCF